MFISLFGERQRVSDQAEDRQREGERENPSRIHALTAEPDGGFEPTNSDNMT